MRDLNARFIAAVMLSCLALQAGLSAQDDAPEAKPGEEKPAERAEDRQRPEPSGSRRIHPMATVRSPPGSSMALSPSSTATVTGGSTMMNCASGCAPY